MMQFSISTKQIYLITLVLMFAFIASYGQNKLKIHYKIEDGLLCNKVYVIAQDSKGFMWLSTDNGICRFDGQTFKRFSTSNGLPDNDLYGMDIDSKDRVWLSTFNRNLCFIQNNEVHTRFNDTNLAKFKVTDYLTFESKLHTSLLVNERGRGDKYYLNQDGKIVQTQSLFSILNLGDYYIKYRTKELILTNTHHTVLDSLDTNFLKKQPYKLVQSASNEFILSTSTGNYKGIIRRKKIELTLINQFDYSKHRLLYKGNQLWSISQNNILCPLDANFNLLHKDEFNLGSIKVMCFFVDRQGGYWIGTEGDGAYYIPNTTIKLYDQSSGMVSENTTLSYANHDELFVLYTNGVIQQMKNNAFANKNIHVSNYCKGRISTLFVNDDYIVCGSDLGDLFVYSRKNHTIHCEHKLGSIKDIEADCDNNIFLAMSSSVCSYDIARNKLCPIIKSRQTCIKRINNQIVLAGSVNKIQEIYYPIHGNTDSIKLLHSFTLENTTISDIQKQDSILVIATVESGIYLYSNYQYQHISTKNGLTDNNCKSVFIDQAHNIWVSTTRGINKIKIKNSIHDFSLEKITTFNGLTTNNINSINQIGNYFYAASSKGILQFPENILSADSNHPEIYISEISMNNRNVQTNVHELFVPPDSNNVKIEVSGIDYKSFGNMRFFYRIKGLFSEWKESPSKIFTLERLKPNQYTLEVYALGSTNLWSVHPAKLKINILPYWWQHILFKWLITLFGILLIYLITKFFLNRQYQKKLTEEELKKHITEVELKALKAQINPHFIFNTLNAIQYFIQNDENEKADNYLNKMSKLIRSTLNFSNEASINLSDEIEYIRTYLELESLRFDDDFSYTLENSIPTSLLNTQIPTMVLQPHIENAIRHGLKPKKGGLKKLTLRFSADESNLYCEIEDNGIGRKNSAELNKNSQLIHTSQGESLSNSKLEIFKKIRKKEVSLDIIDLYKDSQASGTLVKLKIQL